jgi:hypothetical protein
MTHFAMEQWVDYSRDLVGGEERRQMKGHLKAGCQGCRELADLTDRLVNCCASITANRVPEETVRLARAIFPLKPQIRPRRGNRIPIELIFDSFLAPAPTGLRSTWQVGWQGLYRAGECSLDLRIEPELRSSRAAVIGQVTNHVTPSRVMGDLTVSLLSGNRVVAETVSNRFGEFQMEYEQDGQLQLVICLKDANVIQVPLKKLIIEEPAGKSRGTTKKQ